MMRRSMMMLKSSARDEEECEENFAEEAVLEMKKVNKSKKMADIRINEAAGSK